MATIISHSPEDTFEAGRIMAAELQPGAVLALVGDLGAGKTQFVKGIAVGLGSDAAVTSPTFTLIHEYPGGRLPLYHADAYRLATAAEFTSIGLDEYLDGRGALIVEWANKFPDLIPIGSRWLEFQIGEGDERKIVILGSCRDPGSQPVEDLP